MLRAMRSALQPQWASRMFELLRATRRYGRATKLLEAGRSEEHYQTLLDVYRLMSHEGVSRTSSGYFSLSMSALTELAKEAIHRNDLALAREVLRGVTDTWNINVAKFPRLAENRTFVAWFEWVQAEASELKTGRNRGI